MTEPKPVEQYGEGMGKIFGPDKLGDEELDRALAQRADEFFTNSMVQPNGELIDPMDEFVRWDALSDEALQVTEEMVAQRTEHRVTTVPQIIPPPTLEERVGNLEALVSDLLNPYFGVMCPVRPELALLERIRKLEARVAELEAKAE